MSKGYTVGIDLGGTKVAAALVDGSGKISAEARRPTVPPSMSSSALQSTEMPSAKDVRHHVDYVLTAMAEAVFECVDALPAKAKLHGIGLASAGPMDIEKGLIIDPPNFRGWKKVAIVQGLGDKLKPKKLRSHIHFQNDAIAAALGEGWVGAAKGCNTYVAITVGTGIGTGVIFNGRPAQSRGMGSEWGHMISESAGFGRDPLRVRELEVEGIASGTGITRRARAMNLTSTRTVELAEADSAGDPKARELFEACSDALAGLFYSLSLGFHPEVFAVSGGMLGIKDHFLPQAIETYKTAMKAYNPSFLSPIRIAKLGTKAGVVGAARLPRLTE